MSQQKYRSPAAGQTARRAAWKAAGLCVTCGAVREITDRKTCAACIQRVSASRRRAGLIGGGRPPLAPEQRQQSAKARRSSYMKPVFVDDGPRLPFYPVVHQFIPSISPPLRGSIAMQMAWAGLKRTA